MISRQYDVYFSGAIRKVPGVETGISYNSLKSKLSYLKKRDEIKYILLEQQKTLYSVVDRSIQYSGSRTVEQIIKTG